jgi:hypothetical protein
MFLAVQRSPTTVPSSSHGPAGQSFLLDSADARSKQRNCQRDGVIGGGVALNCYDGDKADYVVRVCGAWDFGLVPRLEAFQLLRSWRRFSIASRLGHPRRTPRYECCTAGPQSIPAGCSVRDTNALTRVSVKCQSRAPTPREQTRRVSRRGRSSFARPRRPFRGASLRACCIGV